MVHWESQLERDRFYLLEADPAVLEFYEQPRTYELYVEGVLRRYTPDIEVRYANEVVIEEVKPSDKVNLDMALYEVFASYMAKRGMRFKIVTEQEIQQQPRLDNVKCLYRYAQHSMDHRALKALISSVSAVRPQNFQDLKHLASEVSEDPALPWAFLAQGYLDLPDDEPITDRSRIIFKRGEAS